MIYALKNKLMQARNFNKTHSNLTFNHFDYKTYLENSVKNTLLDAKLNNNLI
jgi:hypothetical protein